MVRTLEAIRSRSNFAAMAWSQGLVSARGRTTVTRVAVLAVFHGESLALSIDEVMRRLDFGFDAVTVYRCLKWLTQGSLLKQVNDQEGARRWGLTEDQLHLAVFHCDVCDRMWFVRAPALFPSVAVDGGFSNRGLLTSFGRCHDCCAGAGDREG